MTNLAAERRLAIVIPAWRARHFTAALESLRAQTDQRFRLYIGDDGSPDDLRSIAESATAGLDVVYHRFPQNLGGTDLVAHWHRCIALTEGESWIWLFSDDDIAEPGCVAAFHRLLDQGTEGATLLRFNASVIDEIGREIRRPAPHPDRETAAELLAAVLVGGPRFWCAPDHIFSRVAFERTGGFVSFPHALHSDLATWVRFTAEGHVRTLPDAKIHFRKHELGTSSGRLVAHMEALLEATVRMEQFALATAHQLAPDQVERIHRLTNKHLLSILNRMHAGTESSHAFVRLCWNQSRRASEPYRWILRFFALRIAARALPGLNRLSAWRYRRSLRPT